MTDDPTTQADETPEEVDHVTGELVPVAPNRPTWVEQLRPNQTTDGYVPAMPALLRAADLIYQTPFVPKGLRTPGGTLGAMMYGRELGLPPITSLQSLHEINGKVGMSAEMMRARITAAGHEFVIVEATAQRCRIRCRRKEDKLDPEAWRVVEYLYSEAGQEIAARNYYRPTLAKVAQKYASQFPQVKLFTIDEAATLEELERDPMAYVRPADMAIQDLKKASCSAKQCAFLLQGRPVPFAGPHLADGDIIRVYGPNQRLMGIARYDGEHHILRPHKMFAEGL